MSLHGACRSIIVNGRLFKTAHDGSGSKVLGGKNNEIQMNGDGSFRTIQTLTPGSFSDIGVVIDDSRGDLEFLQYVANQGLTVPVTVTYASGISYTGDLTLTGEIKPDENTGLASLSFMGGNLTQI